MNDQWVENILSAESGKKHIWYLIKVHIVGNLIILSAYHVAAFMWFYLLNMDENP